LTTSSPSGRVSDTTSASAVPGSTHSGGTVGTLEVQQVVLVDVPAQRGGGVAHRHATGGEAVDPGEELVDVVNVAPGAAGQDEVVVRPLDGRVAPDRRHGVDARTGQGGARQRPVVVQVGLEGAGGGGQPWPVCQGARSRAAQLPIGKWQAT
jgi:hypothetical protein